MITTVRDLGRCGKLGAKEIMKKMPSLCGFKGDLNQDGMDRDSNQAV